MSNDTLSCIISINLQAFYDPFVFQHHPNQSMNPFQKANSPAIPHIYGERAAQKDIRCCLLRPQINHTRTETPRNPPKNISPPPSQKATVFCLFSPAWLRLINLDPVSLRRGLVLGSGWLSVCQWWRCPMDPTDDDDDYDKATNHTRRTHHLRIWSIWEGWNRNMG